MKKIFTLLTLALISIGTAWADDTYTVSFETSSWVSDQPTPNYFTSVGEKNNVNTKYACKYNGTDYAMGLKMEGTTKVQFTTTRTFDITIVRSTTKNAGNSINFGPEPGDKSALSFGSTLSDENNADVAVATMTGLSAGTYQIVKGDGEAGIVYVSVTEKGSAMTQLTTPVITYVSSTGEVTIGAVANATKVTYTTDGVAPTAESTTYSAPFVVEDGTVVKAIAIGNGTTYSNSNVATETVYRTGITVATPVIKQFNGAVAITCATADATIKYSTDGGSTYNTYTRSFTLAADATVKAYAERSGCTTSAEASADVTVVASNKTKTIYLDFNDFDITGNIATGVAGSDAEDYVLTIGNTEKSWSSNGIKIKTPDGDKREFKLSNGAQNTLKIPAGVHVTKLTLYSVIMDNSNTTANGWKEVGGTDYQSGDEDYKNVPMGAYKDVEGYNTNPDIRVYAIDQTGGAITFTNAGNQLSFVAALDILEDQVTITPAKDLTTYVTTTAVDFTGLELKAYVATAASATAVTLAEVTTVPAGTPLVLEGTAGTAYNVPVIATATAPASNLLKAGDGVKKIGGTGKYDYILVDGLFYLADAGVLPAGKAYLHLEADPSASREFLELDFGGDVTAISEMEDVSSKKDDVYYDLQGRRMLYPTKGLYIVNGKKIIIK